MDKVDNSVNNLDICFNICGKYTTALWITICQIIIISITLMSTLTETKHNLSEYILLCRKIETSGMHLKFQSFIKLIRLTWSFPPHSPAAGLATVYAFTTPRLRQIAGQDLHLNRTMLTGIFAGLRGSLRLRLASTFNHRPG